MVLNDSYEAQNEDKLYCDNFWLCKISYYLLCILLF